MVNITIVSDLHVGAGNGVKESIGSLVDEIRDKDPHSVFVLGDVIHDNSDGSERENLEYVVDEFSRLENPTYFLAGNHDANAFDKQTFENVTGTDLNSVADIGDEYVTLIDSAFGRKYENTSYLGDEAIQTLEETMEYDPKPIVLSHFPITYSDMYQESEWFSEYPEGVFPVDKKRVMDLDETPNLVVCGHMHFNDYITWVNNNIVTSVIRPYTQFESIDDPYCTGWYVTPDTDSLRNLI